MGEWVGDGVSKRRNAWSSGRESPCATEAGRDSKVNGGGGVWVPVRLHVGIRQQWVLGSPCAWAPALLSLGAKGGSLCQPSSKLPCAHVGKE